MSQVDLAKALKMHPPTLNRWIKGRSEPTLAEIERLCGALGVSPGFFFGEATSVKIPPSHDVIIRVISDALKKK